MWFEKWARAVAIISGSWQAFTAALALILAWVFGGFFVGFGDELYQLIINTVTTIITFLMIFLVQHTQNKDTAAINLKLDELVRVTSAARNKLIGVEEYTDEDIKRLKEGFQE
jgi:low affinity Fe/Cu permease